MRQQDAYLAIRPAYPRGCCPWPLKGTKHICNQCFYTGKFWRWSAHVPPVYRLQTTKGEKLQNCTSHVLAHPVDIWGKIRQYKWHSCTEEIPTFILGTPYVPIFFVLSEIQRSKLQKLSKKYKFSYFMGHRVETPRPILTVLQQNVHRSMPYILDHIWHRWEKQKW